MPGSRGYGPVGVATLRGTLYRLSIWVQEKYATKLSTLSPVYYKKQLQGVHRMRAQDTKSNQMLPLTWEILVLPATAPGGSPVAGDVG